MDIKLNFINRSNDVNNSDIAIFQKNVATDFEETAVAWQVIRNCGQGENHPFSMPMETQVGASDSWGNFTPRLDAQNGQKFHMVMTNSGDKLAYAGPGTSPQEIQIGNDLVKGAINAGIYKDGKLLAQKSSIAPGQKAVFEFKPTIWIGVVSEVDEGQGMDSAIMSDINTEISLMGVASADIVMTGGGAGPNSRPFEFTLENVEMA